MKKNLLVFGLSLFAAWSLPTGHSAFAAATATTVQAQDDAFFLGVRTAQGDAAYFQQAVNDGSMTYDQYQETIFTMRQLALERSNDPGYTQEEQRYYAGYAEGLAFA